MKIERIDSCKRGFGGKAYGLHVLAQKGFRIPKTFALDYEFAQEIFKHNNQEMRAFLQQHLEKLNCRHVAVRSSADEEDGKSKSYAGVFTTKLNVKNSVDDVIYAMKEVMESAINKKVEIYSKEKVVMNIVIQEMIDSSWSGVCFTRCRDGKGRNIFYAEYVEGLGDKLVSGHEMPKKIVIELSKDRKQFVNIDLGNAKMSDIGSGLVAFEELLQFEAPMDIEWCIDNRGNFFGLQARPITKEIVIDEKSLDATIVVKGEVEGTAYVLKDDDDKTLEEALTNFREGDILVAKYTDTEYLPIISKASAILTEEGALLSHAAIIAREMGKICAIGIKDLTKKINTGDELKIDLKKGMLNIGSGEQINLKKRKWYDELDLYNFERIIEIHEGDKILLVEFLIGSIAIYCDEDLGEEYINRLRDALNQKYHLEVKVCRDNKYIWYFEYKRFMKHSTFQYLLNKAKHISRSMDEEKLLLLYDGVTNYCAELAILRDKLNDIERFYVNEIIISCYYILDLYIPCGIGVLESYLKFMEIGMFTSCELEEFLSDELQICDGRAEKIKKFMLEMARLHNQIWNKWTALNIRDYDFFDNRDKEISNISKRYNIERSIDEVYGLFDEIPELVNKIEKMFINKVKI